VVEFIATEIAPAVKDLRQNGTTNLGPLCSTFVDCRLLGCELRAVKPGKHILINSLALSHFREVFPKESPWRLEG
jgi:hypothetical protein